MTAWPAFDFRPRFRTVAIGDVHGARRALETLLAAVDPRPDDLVVTVGDYVDRGPDSAGVIRCLLDLATRCHLLPIRGNHDQMMLDARRDEYELALWLRCGGDATLASYGGGLESVHADHWRFLAETCVDSVETAKVIYVHGGVVPELRVDKVQPVVLQWQRFPPDRPHVSGKLVVCGHTVQRDHRPRLVRGSLGIDTDADRGGWLTAVDVDSGRYWQANEAGETRGGGVDLALV